MVGTEVRFTVLDQIKSSLMIKSVILNTNKDETAKLGLLKAQPPNLLWLSFDWIDINELEVPDECESLKIRQVSNF